MMTTTSSSQALPIPFFWFVRIPGFALSGRWRRLGCLGSRRRIGFRSILLLSLFQLSFKGSKTAQNCGTKELTVVTPVHNSLASRSIRWAAWQPTCVYLSIGIGDCHEILCLRHDKTERGSSADFFQDSLFIAHSQCRSSLKQSIRLLELCRDSNVSADRKPFHPTTRDCRNSA